MSDDGHGQHRLGDLPRRGDPSRLRHQRHLADADGAEQPDDRASAPTPSPPASSSSAARAPRDAPTATRREFVAALKAELPAALAHLQRGNIAPVDLAQAAIGPGMAVYTRYAKVLDAEGKPLVRARGAGAHQPDPRRGAGRAGGRLRRRQPLGAGLVRAVGLRRGRVRRGRDALQGQEHQRRRHGRGGHPRRRGAARCGCCRPERAAGRLGPGDRPAPDRLGDRPSPDPRARARRRSAQRPQLVGEARRARPRSPASWPTASTPLCERKKRAAEALAYNGLVQSWPEIVAAGAREAGSAAAEQGGLFGRRGIAHGHHQPRTRRQGAGAAQGRARARSSSASSRAQHGAALARRGAAAATSATTGSTRRRRSRSGTSAALLAVDVGPVERRLPQDARATRSAALVSELRDVRNKWAHQEPFSERRRRTARSTRPARLLTAVSAPQADEVEQDEDGAAAPPLRRAGARREAQERRHGHRERRRPAASSRGARS